MHSIKEIKNGGQLQEVIKKLSQLGITVQYTKKIFKKPYLKILFGDKFMIDRQLHQTDCIELKRDLKITAININLLKKIRPFPAPSYEAPIALDGYDSEQKFFPYPFEREKEIKLPSYLSKLPPTVAKEKNESEYIDDLSESVKISPKR